MNTTPSASTSALVSRDSVKVVLHRLLRQEVHIRRVWTADALAAESGVPIATLRCYMKPDIAECKEPSLSYALSIAAVIGSRAVNAILAIIGYVAQPIDEALRKGPAHAAAEAMCHLGRFATAAADNRIDDHEEGITQAAADAMIELLAPFSSQGQAA